MPYSQASDHRVTDGLTKNMLLIGTPLVVTCRSSFIHSWIYSICRSWSRCGPHFPPIFSKCYSRFKKYRACRITCAAWLSFPINDSSFLSNFLLKLMPLLCQWSRLFVSVLIGMPSESECLCSTLGMFCARIVVLPPPVFLRIVDRLISGVLMALVVRIVYGWPKEPHFFAIYPMFVIDRYGYDVVK